MDSEKRQEQLMGTIELPNPLQWTKKCGGQKKNSYTALGTTDKIE